jgi:hypothetical protein
VSASSCPRTLTASASSLALTSQLVAADFLDRVLIFLRNGGVTL